MIREMWCCGRMSRYSWKWPSWTMSGRLPPTSSTTMSLSWTWLFKFARKSLKKTISIECLRSGSVLVGIGVRWACLRRLARLNRRKSQAIRSIKYSNKKSSYLTIRATNKITNIWWSMNGSNQKIAFPRQPRRLIKTLLPESKSIT